MRTLTDCRAEPNFYLPIFFARGIRLEIEVTDEIEEFYVQIDYRIEARRRPAPRLESQKSGDGLTLKYLINFAP